MLLRIQDLEVSYGTIKAVHGVSFEVEEGRSFRYQVDGGTESSVTE